MKSSFLLAYFFSSLGVAHLLGQSQATGVAKKELNRTTTSPALEEFVGERLTAATRQYDHLLSEIPPREGVPYSFDKGSLVLVEPDQWTSGFFPGSLWLLYEATGEEIWRTRAERYTAMLVQQQYNRSTHDLGFIIFSSYGNGFRLTGNPAYRNVLLTAAKSLSSRYDPRVGLIRSWDDPKWTYPVIIDNMMNLELLTWAGREGALLKYRQIAISHADRSMQTHFRSDGSNIHLVDYKPETGEVLRKETYQGASNSSAWARGQGWAIYGYTMMYREVREKRYLAQAQKAADFFMNHARLPADKIPYWDFDAPDIPNSPRDTSAAAVTCSALFELALFSDSQASRRYTVFAEDQLRSLASPTYSASFGESGGFILNHATANFPGHKGVDVSLSYADYYYLEALLRARTWSQKNSSLTSASR